MSKDITELMKPRWRQWPLAPKYEVSDNGDVRNKETGKVLRPGNNYNGYKYVDLQLGKSKARKFYIARMVAEMFVDNPNNAPTVNHLDGVKTNNHYLNLEWTSYKQNSQHAFKTGLGKSGLRHYSCKFSLDDVKEIRELGSLGVKRFEIARIYSVSESAIDNLINWRSYKNVEPYTVDLMRPRFKVKELYPFSQFKIGQIITTGENSHLYRMLEQFPNVFARLQWWEERKPEEMPEYVKGVSGHMKDRFYKICDPSQDRRIWHKDYEIEHRFFKSYPRWFIPATPDEYRSFLNKLLNPDSKNKAG
jgi:hypothetical protein